MYCTIVSLPIARRCRCTKHLAHVPVADALVADIAEPRVTHPDLG